MTQVRGRRATERSSRREHLREWRRDSLWLWPAVGAVVAGAAALVIVAFSPTYLARHGVFSTNIDDARALLGTIATAILTFTGVVFSITLVSLQMASSQYSPRVLRTFVRRPVTKLSLTVFIATFVYSLTVLARLRGSDAAGTPVPAGAVGVAYGLVVASVFVFVVFVHSTVRSMRVSYLVEDVSRETLGALDHVFPQASHYLDAPMPVFEATPRALSFDRRAGVLDGVQAAELVRLAQRHDCVVRLHVEVGTYLPRGATLAEVFSGPGPAGEGSGRTSLGPAEILRCLDIANVRTLYQDARYGLRQLVDIAIRALSPAVNDPTTAVQVIDRIGNLLRHIAGRPDPSGVYVDDRGTVRLVRPVPSWERLVDLAFTEIGVYGEGSPQITRRLMALFDELSECVSPTQLEPIARHRAHLVEVVERAVADPVARTRALAADPLGLG